MQEQNLNDNQIKSENSRIYVLFYSFFLIPFMIAVFGAVFFLLFKFVTYETNNVEELLNQVKIGSASKRWQSAFELAKVLNNPDADPLTNSFKDQLKSAYERSIHDDPLVRSYLAMAMGATKDSTFGNILINGLKDENLETRIAAIQALGMIQFKAAVDSINSLIQITTTKSERLTATIALGMIGDTLAVPYLKKLLEDEEANPADIFENQSLSEESTSQLYEAINQLDDRSRDILQDRWLADKKLTLHDLAEKYEISAERVRQIEKNAMKKVKQTIASGL